MKIHLFLKNGKLMLLIVLILIALITLAYFYPIKFNDIEIFEKFEPAKVLIAFFGSEQNDRSLDQLVYFRNFQWLSKPISLNNQVHNEISELTGRARIPQQHPYQKNNQEKCKIAKGNIVKEMQPKRSIREIQGSSELQTTVKQKSVEEGRYINGDPLKGYYDFVITEGSYKFWAAFQLGTAILIIYSTFAAIYYTKINPLVADYDYHEYLGGNPARSLSNDVDFEDADDDDGDNNKGITAREFRNWLPIMVHSLKFILDAIDKLPADH